MSNINKIKDFGITNVTERRAKNIVKKFEDSFLYLRTVDTTIKVKPTDYPLLYSYKKNLSLEENHIRTPEQLQEIQDDVAKIVLGRKKTLNRKPVLKSIDNVNVRVSIHFSFKLLVSATIDRNKRVQSIIYEGPNDTAMMENKIMEAVHNYIMGISEGGQIVELSIDQIIDILDVGENFKIENMEIRAVDNIVNLVNIFGENVELNKSDNHCVHNVLSKFWKCTAKKIQKIGDNVTVKQLADFCADNKYKCILYDIKGDVIASSQVASKQKILYAVCYNGHLYPLRNAFLKCQRKYNFNNTAKMLLDQESLENKFMELINDGILPADTHYSHRLNSFVHDDIYYFSNDEYEVVEQILTTYGIQDKITPHMNTNNIGATIDKLYIKTNIDSFFPFEFNKVAYNCIRDYNAGEDVTSIDMNQCYSNMLKELPYVLSCDYRYDKVNKTSILTDDCIYNVEVDCDCVLLPQSGLYWGKVLMIAKDHGIPFKIKEWMRCTKHDNYYTQMINDLFDKFDRKVVKEIVNRLIGNMKGREIKNKTNINYINYYDETEKNYRENCTDLEIGNKLYTFDYEISEGKTALFNKAPIHIMVKDMANIAVFEKMKQLKLGDKDIVAILTDNIIFYKKSATFTPCPLWKEISALVPNKNMNIFRETDTTFTLMTPNNIAYPETEFKNTCISAYAGCGKTHHIIHNLLPQLDDYIVLSPTHASINEYRVKDINCDVIQKYTFNFSMPEEKHIIIDEIGMCDSLSWNLIIRLRMAGKIIYAYGDFNQLRPFGETRMIQTTFLTSIFDQIVHAQTNFRNNISRENYTNMMYNGLNNEQKKYFLDKYCTHDEPDIYIGFRKETCRLKNLEILEKMGKYKDGKFTDLEGVKVICKTNDLRDIGLYNNFPAVIEEHEQDKYVKINGHQITWSKFSNKFVFGYAVNLHCVQGQSIEKMHFLRDDEKFLTDGPVFYTLISRFKETLLKKQIKLNEKNTIEFDIRRNGETI